MPSYPIQPAPLGISPVRLQIASIVQSGTTTATVNIDPASHYAVNNFCQAGDPITILGVTDTTWNGAFSILAVTGSFQFTIVTTFAITHTASPGGYVYFPGIAVETITPTGFAAGQRLTIAGADNSVYDAVYPCRYHSSNDHILYLQTASATSSLNSGNQTGTDVIPTDLTFNGVQWETVIAAPHQLRTTGTTDSQNILLDYVVATNFGLSIPAGSNIVGVSVKVNFQSQTFTSSTLENVALYAGGVQVGTAKISDTFFTPVAQDLILGGSADTWGATLTQAIVNGSTFGFGVQVQHVFRSGASSNRLFINSFSITVYYQSSTPDILSSGNGTLSGGATGAVTATLVAAPTSITTGGSSTLTWTSTGASTATLLAQDADGNTTISSVDPNGSEVVSPVVTTTYSLVAIGATDSATATAKVTVTDAPSATLTLNPEKITSGQSSTLTWTTANADTGSIDQGIGSVALAGSMTVSPLVTTIYTLTATNSGTGNSVKVKATLVVNGVTPPIPVFSPQAFKIAAMASQGSDDHLWICDQATGNVYGSSAPDFNSFPASSGPYLRTQYLPLTGSGFVSTNGSAGVVKDKNGNFWWAAFGTAPSTINIDPVNVIPPSPLTYSDRTAWTATDGQVNGGTEPGHPPPDAIDGNLATYWGNSYLVPGTRWINIDTKIAGFEPSFMSFILHGAPGLPNIKFFASDDGVTYTQVGGNLTVDTSNITTEQIFILPAGTSGRFFRLQSDTQAFEVTEFYLGVGYGGAIDRVSFTLPTPFTVWHAGFDTNKGFNNERGTPALAYRSSDGKLIIASAISVAAIDTATQSISGSVFTMPDPDGTGPILHIAGVSTSGETLVYGNQNVYLLDATLTQTNHWTRVGIDPVHSLYGNFTSAFWDSANNLLWAVTNDGSTTRLFKIDLTGTGSIVASASIGVNEPWAIAWDSTHSNVVAVVGGSSGTGNDTELHVFDPTTLTPTTFTLPIPTNCTNGCMGSIGVSQDGIVWTQAQIVAGPPSVAQPYALNPTDGSTVATSGTRGGLSDEHINVIGVQFDFIANAAFSVAAAGPVIGPVTVILTAGGITGSGGGDNSQAMILLPAFNGGDRRAQKMFGDVFVEAAVAAGNVMFVALWQSQYETQVASYSPTSLAPANGGLRSPYIVNLSTTGLYATDVEAIISWPVGPSTSLITWQPCVIEQPEGIQSRPSDWDSAGTAGNKFVQGMMLEFDSFGVAKTFGVQRSDDLGVYVPVECPATSLGQRTQSFTFDPPFLAHDMRIISGDGVEWRVYSWKYIFQPYPEQSTAWQTEFISLGTGWNHILFINLPHISTADITLTLTFDQGPVSSIVVTVPNSGGVLTKTKVTLGMNKFKLISFKVSSTAKCTVFARDLEVWCKAWGSTGPYTPVKPFGGPSSEGAEV